ncbi:hypothetical protein KC349_g3652 [Hortaea werneckii]|nr:hypothetical protein KC349_g3652 [Hortaea werneckii]
MQAPKACKRNLCDVGICFAKTDPSAVLECVRCPLSTSMSWAASSNVLTCLEEINIEEYYDDGKDDSKIWYRSIYPDMKLIHPEELDPDVSLGLSYRGLVVDPNVFLPWAFTTLQNMGVDFVRQEVIDFRHAKEITGAEILVNASGLGARRLGPDPNVHGVRGQTIFVNCTTNDEQCYKRAVIRQGSQYTYAIPRQSSRGIVLGGVSEQHNVSPEVDPSTRLDIMKRVNRMTKGMFDWVNLEKDIRLDIVGFRPARHGGMRLEREGDVIHAYGVGGLGYLYAFGVAEQVKLLATGGKIPVKL